ncbi:uncharacterized protein LOC119658765 [Hermetia illucens]|uniref:uncharacterized protein LOC119658765 n=1 Tax=Hermetia illucens TaxID=343691 RepID=UPI0018CBFD49|nr:uncharacterized protein LOC119658765 [Hermetia illucens]
MITMRFITYVCLAVLFSGLIGSCSAIQCYRCVVTPTYRSDFNTTIPLCSKFEETDEFVIDCPYSTMCQKKVLRMELQKDHVIETVTRGCANQKYTDQVFKQGAWRREHKVEEPYSEECREFKENTLSASSTTYCHCRGNLCNSATKDSAGYHTDAMAVIFVFNAMKYLRSGTAH